MKRIMTIVLAFLLLCCTLEAFAIDSDTIEPVHPEYEGAGKISASISLSSTGILTCSSVVTIEAGHTADVTWVLQGKKGGTWATKATWTASGTGYKNCSLNTARVAVRGYSYRLKATAEISDSSGPHVETVVAYLSVVTYS